VFFHSDDVSEMDKLRDALDQSETKGWYETRCVRLDGSVVAVEAVSLPID
jgi:hypothetical protein